MRLYFLQVTVALVQRGLHAEDASTRFFELGGVDDDRGQALLFEDPAQAG